MDGARFCKGVEIDSQPVSAETAVSIVQGLLEQADVELTPEVAANLQAIVDSLQDLVPNTGAADATTPSTTVNATAGGTVAADTPGSSEGGKKDKKKRKRGLEGGGEVLKPPTTDADVAGLPPVQGKKKKKQQSEACNADGSGAVTQQVAQGAGTDRFVQQQQQQQAAVLHSERTGGKKKKKAVAAGGGRDSTAVTGAQEGPQGHQQGPGPLRGTPTRSPTQVPGSNGNGAAVEEHDLQTPDTGGPGTTIKKKKKKKDKAQRAQAPELPGVLTQRSEDKLHRGTDKGPVGGAGTVQGDATPKAKKDKSAKKRGVKEALQLNGVAASPAAGQQQQQEEAPMQGESGKKRKKHKSKASTGLPHGDGAVEEAGQEGIRRGTLHSASTSAASPSPNAQPASPSAPGAKQRKDKKKTTKKHKQEQALQEG